MENSRPSDKPGSLRPCAIRSVCACILSVCLAGCGEADPAGVSGMRGTNWTLLSFTEDGVVTPALPGVSVTLIFDGDGAHGSGGCNSYGGEYSVSVDGSIRFRNIASTEMFCTAPEGVSEQEARYFTLLLEVSSFEIESGRLRLFSADRARSLTFSAGTP